MYTKHTYIPTKKIYNRSNYAQNQGIKKHEEQLKSPYFPLL